MPFAPIAERATSHDFYAFAAPETMSAIAERIEKLVRSGRRMTCVRRYLGQENTLRIEAGLSLDTEHGDFEFWHQGRPVGSGIGVMLKPGIVGFGISAYEHDVPDEEAAARKWHDNGDRRRNVTHVQITGYGDGSQDRIQIVHYNDYGVGEEITVAFDFVHSSDLTEAEVKVVQALRAGKESWNGEDLDQLITAMRYRWEPVEKAIERIIKENA